MEKIEFVDLKTQQARIRPRLEKRFKEILDHGGYVMGPELTELETKLKQFTGAKHALGVSNGTDALLMAYLALDLKPGDEIVTSAFSFAAAVEMALLMGVNVRFADIHPDTWNLDPAKLEAAITPRTKAIVPVNIYGRCADYAEIMPIANAKKIPVIEDAAQSMGAEYQGKKSGNWGVIACTSFYPAKTLGAYGDAGGVFSNDDEMAHRLKIIRHHGEETRYHHARIGINGRLDSFQAAVLIEKLGILDDEIRARRRLAARYSERLPARVKKPSLSANQQSAWALYTIEVDRRDEVRAKLADLGVPTAVHYPKPLSLQSAYASSGYKVGDLPVTEAACSRVISLPFHPYLSDEQADYVAEALLKSLPR